MGAQILIPAKRVLWEVAEHDENANPLGFELFEME